MVDRRVDRDVLGHLQIVEVARLAPDVDAHPRTPDGLEQGAVVAPAVLPDRDDVEVPIDGGVRGVEVHRRAVRDREQLLGRESGIEEDRGLGPRQVGDQGHLAQRRDEGTAPVGRHARQVVGEPAGPEHQGAMRVRPQAQPARPGGRVPLPLQQRQNQVGTGDQPYGAHGAVDREADPMQRDVA
jgi:hypothetical protein